MSIVPLPPDTVKGAEYTFVNADTGEIFTLSGTETKKGVILRLDTSRNCCQYRIDRNK